MADQMPPHDPLGDRLRATFAAERDDLERRHLASGAAPTRGRSLRWIPFAVAAAVIAIAGFVFIGNRSNDQAVELDVAGQLTDDQTPSPVGTPVDGSGQPLATPTSYPGVPEEFPYITGMNMCGDNYNPNVSMVFRPTGEGTPALAAPEASGERGVTRILTDGSTVELVGGCTAAETSQGPMQWYEIKGPSGAPNEWIRSDYLAVRAIDDPVIPAANKCADAVPNVPHFIWDVRATDPDGGLIAHTAAGVDEPTTRIIGFDEIVAPTGGCTLASNGAPWYELRGPGLTTDWVNAQYLMPAEPACLQGEQFGTSTRDGWDIHVVASGDRLGSIADQYGIGLEELISANPQMDPNLIIFGQLLTIPGLAEEPKLVVGPLAGWAVADGDRVAFSHSTEIYRWYAADGATFATQCSALPTDYPLNGQPCMRVAAPVTGSSSESPEYAPWPAGDRTSTADHVHDITTESNDTCTRVVITFGDNANDGGADEPSSILPPIMVNQGLEFVRISPQGWAMESAFMDTDRVDYPGGVGLLALYPGYNFAVELMFADMQPNVRFLSDPARVVVDLFPVESTDPTETGPFGERFVLRGPIQPDLTGPGIPVDNDIVIAGFGRPFEAAGLYRIWSVPDDVDANTFLADPPTPLVEEFFPTSGWAEGWGSFLVPLPDLDPGTYIAVFGELPPTDEIGFYGTGQLFRVTDSPAEEPGTWPEAVLLPNVQLPPE